MREFPTTVRRAFGQALFAVQCGETPPGARPLKGFGGAGVLELSEDDRSGTYRAVYTVRFTTAVYVLHVFQKKSKRGIATPPQEIELVRERFKRAAELHAARMKEKTR
jgi:phage-related protein